MLKKLEILQKLDNGESASTDAEDVLIEGNTISHSAAPQSVETLLDYTGQRGFDYSDITETRILKRDRPTILPQIAADFNDGASTSVSVRIVQRTVINMGSQIRRPTSVPLLTALHKTLLLSWARQHYHWTVDDRKHVTWTIQSGGASVMAWDVCSWRDMGSLMRLETTLTGDTYLSIFSDHLHSFMSIVHSDGLGQFQQDNATPHESRVATKWL
ncbi:hypothetical protein AVEN_151025-1 [Araneus ventricosus]|uniref:Transposase Tc1-like domain-containing protein n=1 Tax=Araneus ventricosus TaxID=182803 RepID=A0A4Y2IA65_ARAVE|nr:hypothetical protein AVEN_151025-1 [Araneus ventricosus]